MSPNKTSKEKVILFHLEAAEPSLIEKWCAEGKLPNINKIKQSGTYGRLDPPGYIDSGCVWPTFSTGTNPGKHGIGFFPRQLKNGTYDIIKKYSTDLIGEHLWETLSNNNVRPLVLDMPLGRRVENYLGTILVNWGDEHVSNPPFSQPANLMDDILQKFGKHELTDWYQHKLESKEAWKELKETIISAIYLRSKVISHLMENRSWDIAILNYGEIHWAGHMAWHLHDPLHPEFDQDIYDHCGNIILESYQALDTCLGNILQEVTSDVKIFLVSPLGMGAQVGGEMILNEILQKLELTPTPVKNEKNILSKTKEKYLPGKQGMTYAVQQMERIVSPKLMMKAKKIIPTKVWDKWTRKFLDIGNTRAESKAFQVPGDHSGLIRINLIGREPKGKVKPGKEYDELCEFISDEFRKLRDPEDGSLIVKDVIKIRDRISGKHVDEMPDLAIVWRENKIIEEVVSTTFGSIKLKEFHKRSGGHINSGFWMASGPGIQEKKEIPIADLMDVSPTILSLFDIPTPANADGQVRKEIFT